MSLRIASISQNNPDNPQVTGVDGLRVVSWYKPGSRSVAAGFWWQAGSANQHPGEQGFAHLAEHLLYNGGQMQCEAFNEFCRSNANCFNAETDRQSTVFYGVMPGNSLQQYAKILLDNLQQTTSRLTQQVLDFHKSVIHNEHTAWQSNPCAYLTDLAMAKAHRGSAFEHPVLGWHGDLPNASLDSVKKYIDTWLRADLLSLVAVGDVDHAQLVQTVKSQLQLSKAEPQFDRQVPFYAGVNRVAMDGDQQSAVVLWPIRRTPGYFDYDPLLTRGLLQELAQCFIEDNLRQRHHLYTYQVDVQTYRHGWLLRIYAAGENILAMDTITNFEIAFVQYLLTQWNGLLVKLRQSQRALSSLMHDDLTDAMHNLGLRLQVNPWHVNPWPSAERGMDPEFLLRGLLNSRPLILQSH